MNKRFAFLFFGISIMGVPLVFKLSEGCMDLKPYVQLAAIRPVSWPELPHDLANFYSRNEGVGLESTFDRPVRLCKLDEVILVGWKDLGVGLDEIPEGWEEFAAVQIGIGMFFDKILYVLNAPSCPQGAILAIGTDIAGPGGNGMYRLESTLVLAETFNGWLAHLKSWEWVEYAVAGWEAPPDKQKIDLYYRKLNPAMKK